MWLHIKLHFYMFESFQLEGLFVTDLLHRCSVIVYSEWTREESKEQPVVSIFACVMATLIRNSTERNWGPVYGNITASDRRPGFQEVAKEPWLVEKSQEWELGGNKFSPVHVKDAANVIWLCVYWLSCVLKQKSLLPRMSKREEERGDWTVKIKHECLVLFMHVTYV